MKLPDGTESRAGWYLWLVGAFFIGALLVHWNVFFVSLLEIIRSYGFKAPTGLPGLALAYLLTFVVSTVFLLPAARFASRRLLMPSAAWIALAAYPLLFVLMNVLEGPPRVLASTAPLAAVVTVVAIHRKRPTLSDPSPV